MDKVTSSSMRCMLVMLWSFSLTFVGGGRFGSTLMPNFFQDSMLIFYDTMTIIELQNSSITDALVSTLMNCFVDSPKCPPFKIILWLVHNIYLRIKHVPNILQFLLWFISKNVQWFFLSLLAGSGIWWRISHSPSFSNINFFWRDIC